jgi:hypothetical protein
VTGVPDPVHLSWQSTTAELEASAHAFRKLNGGERRLQAFGAVFLLVGAFQVLHSPGLGIYLLVVGAVLVSGLLSRLTIRRSMAKTPSLAFTTTCDVSDDGLAFTTPTSSSTTTWDHFTGWAAIPEGIVLTLSNKRMYHFLPSRSAAPYEWQRATDLVSAHVPKHPKA